MVDIDFKVKEVTATNDYAEFVIEPLQPGYGYTIGNALRRVLYTSIPGAAVTFVKISGVKHKFSTLPGLKENIVDLLLNIKDLHIRLSDAKDSAVIKLSVKGTKEITAADLDLPDGVEVLNKDHNIGSLSGPKGKLDMEMTVERGYEYSLADERKASTLGVIPTDAIFTPVKRVNYAVEATRVGRKTNLDKLIVKVWTNGVVSPREALETAAKLLSNSFSQIYQPKSSTTVDTVTSTSTVSNDLMNLTIDELDLPTRIYNSLRNGGIETVGQLIQTPKKDIISMRNMGGKSISVIEEKLAEKGISLSV
ncbi:MAG: DNA-directed RNA polymerase subunit alpha [Candidatus Levybacteria bacterium]|nr:DNA-directed RNA polymerase subunit alpha [Candidatus Levybacteria bacterium]